MDKKYIFTLMIVAGIFSVFFVLQCRKNKGAEPHYIQDEGLIFGTLYSIKYCYSEDIAGDIDAELRKVDSTFSTFNPASIISKINKNDSTVVLNDWFIKLFHKSEEISAQTDGAFDMTVAPLVNLWGFGFEKKDSAGQTVIDSLLQFTGYKTVRLENNRIKKEKPQTMLDASAIAKGYSCDIIASLLESKGITDYLIEIGGEMRGKGVNSSGKCWVVGIRKPTETGYINEPLQQKIRFCEGKGLATSGNYRNFYYKDGKKYAHTIDPKTGYPVQHRLLSASVIASDCMTADAYATAFMVMGLEKSEKLLKQLPELDVFFIYTDEKENWQVYYTEGFKKYMIIE
jgi:thiamine biosynthesis lipoprotein